MFIRPLNSFWSSLLALADQGTSSVKNFLIVVVAARLFAPEAFGEFTAIYLVYTILIGCTQAFIGQEIVLRETAKPTQQQSIRPALSFSLIAGALLSACMIAISLFIGGEIGHSLAALAIVNPILIYQETLRCVSSYLRAPQLALLGDATWTILIVPTGLLLVNSGVKEVAPWALVAAWGVSGAVSAIPMRALLSPHTKRATGSLKQFLRRDYLGNRFLAEYGLVKAVQDVSLLVVGGLASPLLVGAFRGTTTLYGPLNTVFNASASFGTPILKDLREKSRVFAIAGLAVFFSIVTLLFTVALATNLSDVGPLLLGETWEFAKPLVLPIGLQVITRCFSRFAYIGLRISRPRSTLPLRVLASIAYVIAFFGGLHLGGIEGAAWGAFFVGVLQVLNAWGLWAFQLGMKFRTSSANNG